jgi:glycosyltransferase involved in cell wall biosynthesis
VTSAYHGHLRLWQVKRSLRRADLCLFLNDSDRAYAIERLDVLASHTRTVHNGVPDSLLAQGAVQATGDKAGGIAVVGSWATRKGIDYGVPALNTLLARHTNLTVALLGTGVAADVIVGQFDPAIRSRVEVVASYARSDLPDLLRGRSINLFPTLAEGQSLALLETMACGLVPVTTAVGGEGVVRDGFNGLEVQAREAGALVVAVERLLNDHTLLRQLRTQALETARARSWRSAASQLIELYEAALTARA